MTPMGRYLIGNRSGKDSWLAVIEFLNAAHKLTVYLEMKDEELRYFENLCNMLYGPSSQQEKQKADEELTKIMKNPSFANDVEYLFHFFT